MGLMKNQCSMEEKDMDEQRADALLYRLRQLESNIQRAISRASEAELELSAIKGQLENTKSDFEHLREIIKK